MDRVPLQLALTQLECLAELVNLRRKDSEMKTQLKYLDTQISQLNKVCFCLLKLIMSDDVVAVRQCSISISEGTEMLASIADTIQATLTSLEKFGISLLTHKRTFEMQCRGLSCMTATTKPRFKAERK